MSLNFKTIGSFKYFIMPNKRRRGKEMNLLRKFTLSPYFICFLCLMQVSAIEKSRNFNETPREEASSEPTVTRLLKLHQQRARLECNLAPLASARYRDRRQFSGATAEGVGVPNVRNKPSGDVKGGTPTRHGGERKSVGENGNSDIRLGGLLQDGAVIDEMPARAVIKDRLSQLRPVRNSPSLGSQMHAQTRVLDLRTTDTELVSERKSHPDLDSDSYPNSDSDADSERGTENNAGDNEQLYLSPIDQDSVELILWYHSSKSAIKPIYTLDARQSFSSENSMHQHNLARLSPKLEPDKEEEEEEEQEEQEIETEASSVEEYGDSAESPGKQLNYSTKTSDANKSSGSGRRNNNNNNLSVSAASADNDRFTATSQTLTAGVTSRNAKHFAMSKLSSRIRFRISSKKAKAYLIIDKLEAGDAGEYKCRVDFKHARTQYQLTRLEVIVPVSRVQIRISKEASEGEGKSRSRSKSGKEKKRVDLWPPSEIVSQVNHSQLALLEANEEENIQLVCKAKDGWPNARLAWFRVDWPHSNDSRLDVATRVTQLSIFPTEMESTVDDTVGLINKSKDLINTLSTLENGNKISLTPNNSQQTYPNVNNLTLNLAHLRLLNLMANELRIALRNVFENLQVKQQHQLQNSDSNKSTVISMLARELSSILDAKIDGHYSATELDTSTSNTSKIKSEVTNKKQRDLSIEEETLLRIIRQNQLVLYTCAASNTHNHNKLLSLNDNELGDKLAKIRPLFKSILIQPNVRPRRIQMFLVGKRRSTSSSKSEISELSLLQKDQNLHLNLAASPSSDSKRHQQQQSLFGDGKSEHQLQLVCQVGGSLPEAKIEWYKHNSLPLDNTTNNSPEEMEINTNIRSQSGRLALISDSKFETKSLIRASELSSSGLITSTIATATSTNDSTLLPIQWSSVKVHNITFEDHQTVISCSASNEKFSSSTSSYNALNYEDISTGLSTSLKLNITHVPSVKLELDSTMKLKELQSNSSQHFQEDRRELDVMTLRDGPSLSKSTSSGRGYLADQVVNNQDTTTVIKQNNAKVAEERRSDVRPVLIGYNYTLVCRVVFANPKIHEPIEWHLKYKENNFEPLDEVNWLVRVVEKISTQNRYHIIEKLIVQFSDDSQLEKEIQLICKARNALGQAQSNTIKMITGQKPRCHKSNLKSFESFANDDKNSGNDSADKRIEPSIECPVISDKNSSRYHWLLQLGTDKRNTKMTTDTTITDLTPSIKIKTNLDHTNNNLATVTKTISNTFEFFTSNRTIQSSTLKYILSNNSLNGLIDENDSLPGLKITCFAIDEFGSNFNNPCAVSLLGGQSRGDYSAFHDQCLASLIHRNNLASKVEQPDNNSLTSDPSTLNTTEKTEKKQIKALEPKHFLIIECKDDNVNNSSQLKRARGSNLKERKDEVVHFDLYTRDKSKFVKHLTRYQKDEDSNNLSVKIDLGQDLSLLPIGNFENQHVVVMSFTDSNNRQKQPNVTLTLTNANFNSDSIATSARSSNIPLFKLPDSDQVFPHLHSSELPATLGHEDGLWLISSVCVVFASSVMILLITWMCLSTVSSGKNETQTPTGDNNSESNSKADINDNNSTSQAADPGQTEMYLVGEQLQISRPNVYHNFTTSKPLLSTSVTNIHEKQDQREYQLVTTSFNYNQSGPSNSNNSNTPNPFDLLIIDSKLSNNSGENLTKQAILLLDDHHAQGHRACPATFDQGYSGRCSYQSDLTNSRTVGRSSILIDQQLNQIPNIGNRYRGGSMIHIHPSSGDESNTYLRAVCHDNCISNDCSNSVNQNIRNALSSSKSGSSPETQACDSTKVDKYSSGQYEFIDLDSRTHQLVRSPIGLVTSVVPQIPGRCNTTGFELNSCGELTVTDESSSFIQEEGAIDTQLNLSQSVCNQCRIENNAHRRDIKAINVYKPKSNCCVECQRITPNTTPSDGHHSNGSVSLLSKTLSFDPSPTSDQISTLKRSTIKSENENESKRSERVRFVDHQGLLKSSKRESSEIDR